MKRTGPAFAAARAFNVRAALLLADQILASPPSRRHIVRQPAAGDRLHRFALPLELCETRNLNRFAPKWALASKREAILQMLAIQLRHQLPASPLGGRPIVQCIRFSSRAPDAGADSFKMPIDCLCPPRTRKYKGTLRRIPGVGLIADDRPERCDVRQRWEYTPSGTGFGLIDVYSGEAQE